MTPRTFDRLMVLAATHAAQTRNERNLATRQLGADSPVTKAYATEAAAAQAVVDELADLRSYAEAG